MRLLACLPALVLAAVIWWLSSTPDLAVASGTLDTVLRKVAHVGVFALLTLLCVFGLRANRLSRERAIVGGAVLALTYAIVDEVHQSFVPTRNGAATDVAIDALGVGLATVTLLVRARRPLPC